MNAAPCPELTSLLLRAAEDALDDVELADLDEHLRTCRGCRMALAEQRGVRAALVARPGLEASPAFRVRVREAIERDRRDWSLLLDYRRWSWRLAPLATILVAAIALGIPQIDRIGTDDDETADAAGIAQWPVAAALFSSDVQVGSLESLLLVAGPDAALGDFTQEGGR